MDELTIVRRDLARQRQRRSRLEDEQVHKRRTYAEARDGLASMVANGWSVSFADRERVRERASELEVLAEAIAGVDRMIEICKAQEARLLQEQAPVEAPTTPATETFHL